MQDIGDTIVESIQRNFEEARSPELQPWAKLSKRYLEWKVGVKKRKAGNILRLNNILYNSIHPEPSRRRVIVGTNVPYAAIHQFGGTINKAASKSTVYFNQNKKTGEVGTKFVKKSKSNFAQDVNVRAHVINIKPRPFIGIREGDYPEIQDAVAQYIIGDLA
jgi:phage virion morphogenesis protein